MKILYGVLVTGIVCDYGSKSNGRHRRDADTSLSAALSECEKFYTERGFETGTTGKRLGGGGQSEVYKCENENDTEVPKVVAKLYMRPWEFNMTERATIDTNLGTLGIGAQVYKFFYNPETITSPSSRDHAGKIEEFLTGKDLEEPDLPKPEIYRAVAKKMAQLHSITKQQMPVDEHFGESIWPWNTKLIKDHLNQQWFQDSGAFNHVWKKLGMNTSMAQEIDFADQKIKESTTPTTFCHNDPHNGNIMVNRDDNGDMLPDTLLLIDFDNSGWGYRAWDIDYYFSKWPTWPNVATMEDFAATYIAEMNADSVTTLTVAELVTEMRLHQPYLLLEQMMFYYSFLSGYQSPAHLAAYCDVMLNYYNRPVTCGARRMSASLIAVFFSFAGYVLLRIFL